MIKFLKIIKSNCKSKLKKNNCNINEKVLTLINSRKIGAIKIHIPTAKKK